MNKKILRTVSIVLMLTMLLSIAALAIETRSSDYISSYIASATSGGNGNVVVGFSIGATGTMTKLGAERIEVYNSYGNRVKTFKNTDAGYAYMMSSGVKAYGSSVTYKGVSGSSYYAIVYFRAGNSTGSDTATYTTAWMTA